MNNQKHSPLPLSNEDNGRIMDADGWQIAECKGRGLRAFEDAENAHRFVQAVNHHNALVRACKNALDRLTDPYLGEDDGERQKPEVEELRSVLKKVGCK